MAQKYPEEMMVMNRIDKAWNPAVSAWQQHRKSCGKISSPGQLDLSMNSMGHKVGEAYDGFADALGQSFTRGDHGFVSDVEDIEERLLSPLSTSIRTIECNSSGQADPLHDHEAETSQLAVNAVAMTIRTLERLASRLGYNVRPSEPSAPSTEAFSDESGEIDWCKGALLIQQSPNCYPSTLIQLPNQFSKVCKFCYLEIGDYRLKAVQHVDEDWSALASCHVLACSSFKDQRAAFRCFGCHVSGVSNVLTSSAAMFDHIATCDEFTEKRRRSQIPLNIVASTYERDLSHRAQPSSDSSAISTPDTTSTNSARSPTSTPGKPRSQAPPAAKPIPLPTRNPPPVPPAEAGHVQSPRSEAPASLHSIPCTFPMADTTEQSYQPLYALPTTSTQENLSNSTSRSASTPRKPVYPPQAPPSQFPQSARHPPMSPSQHRRTSWNRSMDESSNPPLPQLPAQVKQLMEMGVTRSEAEHGLKETNWDVQQAADLIWRSRQAG